MLPKHQFEDCASSEALYFLDSILGLYLGSAALPVFRTGRVVPLKSGQEFQPSDACGLVVILHGIVAHDAGWFSPGCHVSADIPTLRAQDNPAAIWVADEKALLQERFAGQSLAQLLEDALSAAAEAIAAATPPRDLPDVVTLCDVHHPKIRRQAARLMRMTPEATAQAIFKFVQAMPYRFGTWQERASDTLQRGSGMCTTKANLQVALMRACGLEAGFTEVPMVMSVLGKLMPDAWLPLMRPRVRHYFGAVRLDGCWHAADSSYSDDSMQIYLEQIPGFDYLLPAQIATGKPYSPAHSHDGLDMFDIQVVPHLHDEMGKKSRFSPMQFEALNTRLDRAQGSWRKWVSPDHPDLQALASAEGRVA